jgi:hypothetical protein
MIKKELKVNEFKTTGIITTLLNNAFGKEKKEENNLHNTIEKNKNFLYNIYYDDPYFNEIVKYHNERGKYKVRKLKKHLSILVKNSMKLSKNNLLRKDTKKLSKSNSLPNLLSVITDKIQEIEKEDLEKKKINFTKKLSFFDGLNIKEENKEEKKNIPWLIGLKKNNPVKQLLLPIKIEENLPKNLEKKQPNIFKQIAIQKRASTIIIGRENIQNFSNIIQSQMNKEKERSSLYEKPKYKVTKLSSLVGKCNLEIKRARSIDDYIEKNNEILNHEYNEMLHKKNKLLENYDKTVIEEKEKKKNKYQLLQEQEIQEIKNRINIKISDDYAYKNKNVIKKLIKRKGQSPYEMLLKELKKLNNEKEKKKEAEDRDMRTIENILDLTYKDKEYLKFQLSEKDKKYKKMKEEEQNGDYFPLNISKLDQQLNKNYNI